MTETIIVHKTEHSDSITIGTPGKGGEIKVYFNASDLSEAEKRIDNAVQVRQRLLSRLAGAE